MIKYDRFWVTMKERGITQYDLYEHYQITRSLLDRLRKNKNVEMARFNGKKVIITKVANGIHKADELVERAGREINGNNFGKTDEERYAMLEQLQQARRGRTKKEVVLFKDDEESNEQPNNSITEHFDFDIRQAIISSEIKS